MIILRLIGGLGNQMCQVAYASTLARKLNHELYIDTTSYEKYKIRPCSIHKMNLPDYIKIYEDHNSSYYKRIRLYQRFFHLIQFFVRKQKHQMGKEIFSLLAKHGHYYNFDSFYYGYPECCSENIDIYGYFSGEPYYRDIYSDIKTMFNTKDEYMSEDAKKYLHKIKNAQTPVCVTLRLQDDYVKSTVFNVCSIDYFNKGIRYIKNKVPNASFFVFADDIERAKSLTLDCEAIYVEGVTDVEGMQIMKHCQHFIISNSTFSWWGSYLSEFENKIVIAPKKWMNNNKDYSSMYYKNVVKI